MKKFQFLFFFLMTLGIQTISFGQKYITKTGNLTFEASVASFEEVKGENKAASAILEVNTGKLAVLALVNGFRFKVALMEEHFNENYAESDKFPQSTFSGIIQNFDESKLSSTAKMFVVTGDLTFHGKTKKITTEAKISKSEGKISIKGNFTVKPEDFGVEIPNLVRSKVAKTVEVSYNLALSK